MKITKISLKELVQILNLVARKLEQLDDLETTTDAYKIIGTDEWGNFIADVEPDVGSLKDDWESLQKLLKENDRVVTMVDLDRVATILRAVSEHFSPASGEPE